MANPIQGSSRMATPVKQDGIVGLYDTLTTMRKNLFTKMAYFDIYSGSGTNAIDSETEVQGSPISMLDGIRIATSRMATLPTTARRIVFSDIIAGRATDALPAAVRRWQSANNLPVDPYNLRCPSKTGELVTIPIRYCASSAADAVKDIGRAIAAGWHTIVTIDPNGPKDAPWQELHELFTRRGDRMEMFIHISANTLKRIAGAKAVTGKTFAPTPDHISAMLQQFSGACGWVREPVGADQWTILLLSKFPPRSGWNTKNGARFLKLDSDEGKSLVRRLSLTKKQLLGESL